MNRSICSASGWFIIKIALFVCAFFVSPYRIGSNTGKRLPTRRLHMAQGGQPVAVTGVWYKITFEIEE
jgi:hypothetical protein